MTSLATGARAVRAGLLAAARSTIAALDGGTTNVLIGFGTPGMLDMAGRTDYCLITRTSSRQEPATYGTNRSRAELIDVDIEFSSFQVGGWDQEQVAYDRCSQMLEALERYCRVTDPTLGQVCLWCFPTSHESDGASEEELISEGRLVIITATFTASVRISL